MAEMVEKPLIVSTNNEQIPVRWCRPIRRRRNDDTTSIIHVLYICSLCGLVLLTLHATEHSITHLYNTNTHTPRHTYLGSYIMSILYVSCTCGRIDNKVDFELTLSLEVILVSLSKFRPSNQCADYCSINNIWRLIVALLSAVWALIDSCDWQLAHVLLSLTPGLTPSQTIVAMFHWM